MIKYIVENDGLFYLKRWYPFKTRIWDPYTKCWWDIPDHHVRRLNTKNELVEAYEKSCSKFRGFL